MTNPEIGSRLKQISATLALVANEVAELVDQFHRPRTSPAGMNDHLKRVNALTEAATKLQSSADLIPDTREN
jgi:hypothetical protein